MSPCRTCVYARPATLIDRLECHRFPPIMGMNGWPHVSVDENCGEHSPLSGQIRMEHEPAPPKSPAQTGSENPPAPKKPSRSKSVKN